MFKKILIANRGEIAVRVIRACKEWGISTVAIHSDVDRDSMHVRLADESICVGPHQPSNSYLNIPAIMSAIELTNSEAVHPGYGFLSENAEFAKILEDNNIKFIGPSSSLISKMGDKIQAKKIAKQYGLPVIEGSEGGVSDIKEAKKLSKNLVNKGSIVRSIVTKNTKDKPRSFFDGIDKWAKEQGSSGLAYFTLEKNDKIIGKGPVGKFFSEESLIELMKITNAEIGDTVFLSCGKQNDVEKILSIARTRIAEELKIIKDDYFAFCWIVDYPMFEIDEQTKKISFSHNPFSMPQGDIKNLDLTDPLSLKAYQYDIVCNGIELSSGAIRNHVPELMYKLFDIAGYSKKDVEEKFSGMINALSYGAPPHGGIAPGIDRIVMLLADEKNIREVTMFPMNQNAQDLMMNAPSTINDDQLKELNLTVKKKT